MGETFHVLVGLNSMFPFCHDGVLGETFHVLVGQSCIAGMKLVVAFVVYLGINVTNFLLHFR